MEKDKKIETVLVGILLIMVVLIGCYIYQEKEAQGVSTQTSVSMEYMGK